LNHYFVYNPVEIYKLSWEIGIKKAKELPTLILEMEKKVDERVDEIMGVKQKSREENNKIG